MKKVPTLFVRIYENNKVVGVKDEITPGCEEAFKNGLATVKFDGSCCAIIDGTFFKRYDAKNGKQPPAGSIPCCDPDPVTGHWPHWVAVNLANNTDKWLAKALINTVCGNEVLPDGTYEAIGPHFQANPYKLSEDFLIKHGTLLVNLERNFESIRRYLKENNIEGLVFWLNGEPICKIKRTDFGFDWPVKEA